MKVALISTISIILFAVGGAQAKTVSSTPTTKTLPVRTEASAKEEKKSAQQKRQALADLRKKITFARNSTWSCQDDLRAARIRDKRTPAGTDIWSLPTSVPYRIWVLEYWRDLASKCDKTRESRTIPANLTWYESMKWVQRIYPGTYDWLYYISDREGCIRRTMQECDVVWYGGRPWTGYHVGNDFLGADTVIGPMQFRFSTFAPQWRAAKEWLITHGWFVPDFKMPAAGGDPQYKEWLTPMGQALTAGYMKWSHREGCHWCL